MTAREAAVAEALRLAAWLDRKAEQSPGRIQLDEDEAHLAATALRLLAELYSQEPS